MLLIFGEQHEKQLPLSASSEFMSAPSDLEDFDVFFIFHQAAIQSKLSELQQFLGEDLAFLK